MSIIHPTLINLKSKKEYLLKQSLSNIKIKNPDSKEIEIIQFQRVDENFFLKFNEVNNWAKINDKNIQNKKIKLKNNDVLNFFGLKYKFILPTKTTNFELDLSHGETKKAETPTNQNISKIKIKNTELKVQSPPIGKKSRSSLAKEQEKQSNQEVFQNASISKRFFAFFIDYLVTLIIVQVPELVFPYIPFPAYLKLFAPIIKSVSTILLLHFLYFRVIYHGGQSYGKKLLKLEMITFKGENPGYLQIYMRELILKPIFGLGLFFISIPLFLFSSQKQFIWDKIQKIRVIDLKRNNI